jgi:hypothetical protein
MGEFVRPTFDPTGFRRELNKLRIHNVISSESVTAKLSYQLLNDKNPINNDDLELKCITSKVTQKIECTKSTAFTKIYFLQIKVQHGMGFRKQTYLSFY